MWRELIRDLDPQTFFPGATMLQLTALEEALSITLREESKSLLMESNGVRGEYELRLIWLQRRLSNAICICVPVLHSARVICHLKICSSLLMPGMVISLLILLFQGPSIKRDIFAWDHEDDSRTWVCTFTTALH